MNANKKTIPKPGYNGERGAGRKAFGEAVTLLVAGFLTGALVAPWVARGIVALGRQGGGWEPLVNVPFERITSRCVVVMVGLGLIVGVARGRFGFPDRFGLPVAVAPWKAGWKGLVAGVFLVLVVAAVGWASGVLQPEGAGWSLVWLTVLGLVPAAVVVSVLEEMLFRGIFYANLRRWIGLWPALLISSMLFTAVHFANPVPGEAVAHPHWYSGIALAPDMFRFVHATELYVPYAYSLFVMGIVLGLVVERVGSLGPAIGMHAGWILALGIVRNHFTVVDGVPWFSTSVDLSRGWMALIFLILSVPVVFRLFPASRDNQT